MYNFKNKSVLTPPYKNNGFTLAEVLITLVIIGVIAAITIPTMMNSKRNEELRAGLLKAQSTLAGALEMYYINSGERILPSTLEANQLRPILMKYIATAKDCGNSDCVPIYSDNIYRNYTNTAFVDHERFDEGQFIMNDSMMVLIQNSAYKWLTISVDVNGYKKKPNRSGYDLFMFEINEKGNLVPMGARGTTYHSSVYCTNTSTTTTNGFGCTAKALADPNYFKNLH